MNCANLKSLFCRKCFYLGSLLLDGIKAPITIKDGKYIKQTKSHLITKFGFTIELSTNKIPSAALRKLWHAWC